MLVCAYNASTGEVETGGSLGLVSFRPETDPESKKKVDNSCGTNLRLSSDPHMRANVHTYHPPSQAQVRPKAPSHPRSVYKDQGEGLCHKSGVLRAGNLEPPCTTGKHCPVQDLLCRWCLCGTSQGVGLALDGVL